MNIFYLYFIEMSIKPDRRLFDPTASRVNIQATNVNRSNLTNPGFTRDSRDYIVNKRSDYNKSLRQPNKGGKLRRKTKKYHKKSKKRVRKCKKCRGTQKRR